MVNKIFVIGIIIATAVALGIGIIIGHFAIAKTSVTTVVNKYEKLVRPPNRQNYKTFIDSVQAKNIEEYLRDLTSRPHMAGLPEDLDSAVVIENRWKQDGLTVFKPKYNVLLSYPDNNNPNRVSLKRADGTIIFQTNGTEKVYDSSQPKTVNPFLAYTPNGTVNSAKLYYGNYGRFEDLQELAMRVGAANLNGSIIIMRYGRLFRGNKVMNAQHFGAVGAILYGDPDDYAPFGITSNQTYDKKWYLPPSGAQRGSTYLTNGDPLTPIYPATDYMYRIKEDTVKALPKILAQPIGYGEAQVLLEDAWSLGAIDPTSGTATMLEMTRVLGDMYRNGFRPRRSLMFCSWGAEEYGLLGSVEYVQEYVKVLGARVVSYLNMDSAVKGNYTVSAKTSPMLFDVIVEASKMVPSAYDPPGVTVFDKWMKVLRNNITNEPKIQYGLGSASDYFAFDQLIGSSNFDASYDFDSKEHRKIASHPLYHTSYETFSMMKKFIDPQFLAHKAMCQFIGVLALLLSETSILPFKVTRYALVLQEMMTQFPPNNTHFQLIRTAVQDFDRLAQEFETRERSLNMDNPYEIRAYNDQLLQLERAFLNPLGQGDGYTDFKHIVYAPAKLNQYDASGFPAINDALTNGNQTELDQQIAIAVFFVRGAISTLKQFDQFIFK